MLSGEGKPEINPQRKSRKIDRWMIGFLTPYLVAWGVWTTKSVFELKTEFVKVGVQLTQLNSNLERMFREKSK